MCRFIHSLLRAACNRHHHEAARGLELYMKVPMYPSPFKHFYLHCAGHDDREWHAEDHGAFQRAVPCSSMNVLGLSGVARV